jgi:chemotaxis protein MotB
MRLKSMLVAVMAVLVASGCVSSKEYKARLTEIGSLKDYVTTLEERIKAAEAEYSETAARLTDELKKLRKGEAELLEANARLSQRMEADNLELVKEATELSFQLSETHANAKVLEDELASKTLEVAGLKAELEKLEKEKQEAVEARKKAVAELQGTYDELVSELNEEIEEGRIQVNQLRDKLSLSMVDKVLFDSGSDKVKGGGRKVLDRVADILVKVTDKQIRIEGHTDNVGIGAKLKERFPTNWELSTARALNVVRYLTEQGGIDPGLISAAGYSMHMPVASNETEEGRAKNRRIEIVLIPVDIDRVAPGEKGEAVEPETGQ